MAGSSLVDLGLTTVERIEASSKVKVLEVQVLNKGQKAIAVVEGESGGNYTPMIDFGSAVYECDCPDFGANKALCKHLVKTLIAMKRRDKTFYDKFVTMATVTVGSLGKSSPASAVDGFAGTGCEPIDKLLLGGLPRSCVTTVVGEPDIGKSIFCLQCASVAKKALFIDTEAWILRPGVQQKGLDIFTKRFGKKPDITFEFARNLTQLGELLGMHFDLDTEGMKYKLKIHLDTDVEESPLFKKAKDFELVVLDSFTAPLEKVIPDEAPNYPERAKLVKCVWGRLEAIVEAYQNAMLVTMHISKDPQKAAGHGTPWGGRAVKYNVKYLLHIKSGDSRAYMATGGEARRFLRREYPLQLEDEVTVRLAADYGYRRM